VPPLVEPATWLVMLLAAPAPPLAPALPVPPLPPIWVAVTVTLEGPVLVAFTLPVPPVPMVATPPLPAV
jgi:hypothetical protein